MSKTGFPGPPKRAPAFYDREGLLRLWEISEGELDGYFADGTLRYALPCPAANRHDGYVGLLLDGYSKGTLSRLEAELVPRFNGFPGSPPSIEQLSDMLAEWEPGAPRLSERDPEKLPGFLYNSSVGQAGGEVNPSTNTFWDIEPPPGVGRWKRARFLYQDKARRDYLIVRPDNREELRTTHAPTGEETVFSPAGNGELVVAFTWVGGIVPTEILGTNSTQPISEATSSLLVGLLARRLIIELGTHKYTKGHQNENHNADELIAALSDGLPEFRGASRKNLETPLKAGIEVLKAKLPEGLHDRLFERDLTSPD